MKKISRVACKTEGCSYRVGPERTCGAAPAFVVIDIRGAHELVGIVWACSNHGAQLVAAGMTVDDPVYEVVDPVRPLDYWT